MSDRLLNAATRICENLRSPSDRAIIRALIDEVEMAREQRVAVEVLSEQPHDCPEWADH